MRLNSLDKKVGDLESAIQKERNWKIRNKRVGEVFITVASVIIFVLLFMLVKPKEILGFVGIIGAAALVGGLMLGTYKWLTEEND
jgi:hypothetical protein